MSRSPRTTLVLASASPRRRELLSDAAVPFEVMPAEVDESPRPGEAAEAMALRLALSKALAIAAKIGAPPPRLVLGADTVVVLDGVAFGKPRHPEDAVRMLRQLCGRTHEVVTGVALVLTGGGELGVRSVRSQVALRAATDTELRDYVATGEPLDKAGGYAIQGRGRQLVCALEGSETNVIGLPLEETLALLREGQASLAASEGADQPAAAR